VAPGDDDESGPPGELTVTYGGRLARNPARATPRPNPPPHKPPQADPKRDHKAAGPEPTRYGAAGAGSRSARISFGSPRSGSGTSMVSKSRGTTVAGKIARASSRTSRAK
jgi:hypothetical protein